MAKDINLTSSQWTDIIFEGKNKEYGAYKMRQTSAKRHYYAIGIVALLVTLVALLPYIIDAVKSDKNAEENISEITQLSNVELEEQVKEQDIIKQQEATPPPPLKSTIKFTPPVITDAKDIKEDEQMKSQDDLNETKTQISVADVKGTDDKNGIDIADLEQNKVVVAEPEPEDDKPLVAVEVMPQFPGGELMKYLNDNLRYPTIAAEQGIQGRVVVKFVVSKTGEISDVTVVRQLDPSCDKEAVRVVKSMPKWIPGKQNGRAVSAYFTLPVTFRLQQ